MRKRTRLCCHTCRLCRAERKPMICEHPDTAGRAIRIEPGHTVAAWCPKMTEMMNRRRNG